MNMYENHWISYYLNGFKFNEREQQQLIKILVSYIVSCMRVYVRVSVGVSRNELSVRRRQCSD